MLISNKIDPDGQPYSKLKNCSFKICFGGLGGMKANWRMKFCIQVVFNVSKKVLIQQLLKKQSIFVVKN